MESDETAEVPYCGCLVPKYPIKFAPLCQDPVGCPLSWEGDDLEGETVLPLLL
jgi:hypothetical protein